MITSDKDNKGKEGVSWIYDTPSFSSFFCPTDFSSWDYFVPQISQIYTDFFHRKVFHRISRMNRKAFLLIGLLTDFRRTLAAGQWLAPYICSCFLSHRFHRFLFLRILLISRNTLIINIVLDIT